VLRRLGPLRLTTVFDVGCHVGSWTDQALSQMPTTVVHAFEADPRLAAALIGRFSNDPRVKMNAVGMADETGTHVLFLNEEAPDISSMVDSGTGLPPVDVPVVRGDEYCREHDIERVDFLKIDTEGFDWNVLAGFDTMLGPQLRAIQFEYNEWNVVSRRLLADFHELLEPKGYRIGKVHPNGVAFTPYSVADENWIGPACVAVHESAPDMISAIAVR
jgi:FkbM family methyltransferase